VVETAALGSVVGRAAVDWVAAKAAVVRS
jgi:hypothetical protein